MRSAARTRSRWMKQRKTHSPESSPRGERLQKTLAAAGLASRREAEAWILAGRVSVNGKIVRELGTRVDPKRDRLRVDGRLVGRRERLKHLVLHKPRGVVTTTSDPQRRRTVLDLVPARTRLFPVGRLDAGSEGLLLLTNDGKLAQALLHPSFEVPRVYRVSVDGRPSAAKLKQLASGIVLDGSKTAACEVRVVSDSEERSVLELTLVEGRRRQIRRSLEKLGHPVRRLVRVAFGPIRLGRLRSGEYRELRDPELSALTRLAEGARGSRKRNQPAGGRSTRRSSKR